MANRGVIGPLVGAGGGAALFLWVHGFTVVDPTRIAWLMRSDWRFQFLGWQFFRQEPWGWPPGRSGAGSSRVLRIGYPGARRAPVESETGPAAVR